MAEIKPFSQPQGDGSGGNHESPRQILNRRMHDAMLSAQNAAKLPPAPSTSDINNGLPVLASSPTKDAHTRDSIPPTPNICQARKIISSHLRSLFKPSPMPEKLRKEREEAGFPVPDPNVDYVMVSGGIPENTATQEW